MEKIKSSNFIQIYEKCDMFIDEYNIFSLTYNLIVLDTVPCDLISIKVSDISLTLESEKYPHGFIIILNNGMKIGIKDLKDRHRKRLKERLK